MAAITSSNVANAIVKLVAADALPALMGNLVMGNLVNRDYEPALAQAGDTINVPIPPTLAANNIAEGGTVQTQNPNLGNAQIVLNTHAEATFQIPDVTKILAVPDLLKLYMQPAVVALAEKIETRSAEPVSAVHGEHGGGDGGTAITEAVVDSAETALFAAKVPASAAKYLVVDPATYSALRQIPRFSEFNTAGEAGLRALVDGAVGKMKDFYIFRSQFVAKTGSSPVTTHNLAFAQGCDRPGGAAAAAAAAGDGRDRGVRRAGQLRDAGDDELSAEYAGAAVHGGRAVRRGSAAEQLRGAGEQLGTRAASGLKPRRLACSKRAIWICARITKRSARSRL